MPLFAIVYVTDTPLIKAMKFELGLIKIKLPTQRRYLMLL